MCLCLGVVALPWPLVGHVFPLGTREQSRVTARGLGQPWCWPARPGVLSPHSRPGHRLQRQGSPPVSGHRLHSSSGDSPGAPPPAPPTSARGCDGHLGLSTSVPREPPPPSHPSYTPYFKLPGNVSHSGSLSPSVILTSLSPSLTAAPAHPHSPRLPLTLSHSALSHLPSLSCFLTLTHSGCHPHSLEIPLTLPHLGSL